MKAFLHQYLMVVLLLLLLLLRFLWVQLLLVV
jgi:hypothetical protein